MLEPLLIDLFVAFVDGMARIQYHNTWKGPSYRDLIPFLLYCPSQESTIIQRKMLAIADCLQSEEPALNATAWARTAGFLCFCCGEQSLDFYCSYRTSYGFWAWRWGWGGTCLSRAAQVFNASLPRRVSGSTFTMLS